MAITRGAVTRFFVFIMVVVAIAAGYLRWLVWLRPANPENTRPVEITIPYGTPFPEIGPLLHEAAVLENPLIFKTLARARDVSKKLKAGRYVFPAGVTYDEIVRILEEGRADFISVTIPEGLRIEATAGRLAKGLGLDSTRLVSLARDTSFIRQFELDDPTLEGYLFPETYSFHSTTTAEQALAAMVRQFKRHVTDSIEARMSELGLTLREIVTLASIIEGEAVVDSERTVISAVYHNRLRRGMLLQADPTIQYLVGDRPRRLLYRDLEIDSPYNTYVYPGLPPGPINSPGWRSVEAALYPDPVDYVYFVARGDGSHFFSKSMRQHLNAKRKFDKVRRRVARERREKNQHELHRQSP